MCGYALSLARRAKRIDTKVSILLGLQFPLFLSLAHTRDRRPLRKRERQSGYSCVSFSAFSQFTDSLLLHRWVSLRRRNITVLRNPLTRYTARHLRIRRLVQFIFAGPVCNNALTNCATRSSPRGPSLALRAIHLVSRLRRVADMCSSTVTELRIGKRKGRTP